MNSYFSESARINAGIAMAQAEAQNAHRARYEPLSMHFLMYVNVLVDGQYVERVAVMDRIYGRLALCDTMAEAEAALEEVTR